MARKNPGIFTNWDEVRENIKGVKGAIYKTFGSKALAEKKLLLNIRTNTRTVITRKPKISTLRTIRIKLVIQLSSVWQ